MSEFVIKDSPGKGKGIFSNILFEQGQILFRFDGKQITLQEAKALSTFDSERLLQIGPSIYLNVKEHFGVFTNHSCNPNCYIKISVNNAFLVAARLIKPGDELCFDYSTTSTDTVDTWSMQCNCQPYGCRRVITGFSSVPKEQRNKMISLGMVPSYVIKSL